MSHPPHPPHQLPYQQASGPYPSAPGWPQQYAGAMPVGGPPAGCEVCGASPAAPVTVRGHQGMLVIMRFLRRQGMFCRTCALAVFRDMQADTMVLGWWGPISVFVTPFTLLANVSALSGIKQIPAPVTAGWRPPLDPGKPVFRRPAGVLALIPLGVLGLLLLAVQILLVIGLVAESSGSDHPTLTVGSCVRNDGDWIDQDLRTVPCGSADAQFRVSDPSTSVCLPEDHRAGLEYSKDGATSFCLRSLK
ncbi:LppU/SCO3897 family protein [Streptomyces diastatochromogenes]|uniref:LppU/SCO3897 family protein n=1 Tax=Streptomyces diastatochromogenes TaxID=42236 RepID=UPI0036CDFD84